MIELGRLERIDLRQIWLSEPQGFTPWLAREENLRLLAETIGIELELEGQERNVGPFRADILCKDTDDGSWVLIENQLERTDHLHLGQLLTYAAGLDAVTVVWVAGRFVDEHRAALDWLNRITAESFRFFGLEIELWRIGTSPAAPKFNVIARPNDWTKSVGEAARSIAGGASSERKEEYVRYWSAFGEYLAEHGSELRITRAIPKHVVSFGLGRTGFRLGAFGGWRDKYLVIDLRIQDQPGKPFFHLLYAQRVEIEHELGFPVEWLELPNLQRSRIELRQTGVDPEDGADWPRQHAWLAENLAKFDRVFRPRVAALDIEDWAGGALGEPADHVESEAPDSPGAA